jgi:hypothetical protein
LLVAAVAVEVLQTTAISEAVAVAVLVDLGQPQI